MSTSYQVKLLRVLQEIAVRPVGGHVENAMCELQRLIETWPRKMTAGGLREDLYYRIAVLKVDTPTLRKPPSHLQRRATAPQIRARLDGLYEVHDSTTETLSISRSGEDSSSTFASCEKLSCNSVADLLSRIVSSEHAARSHMSVSTASPTSRLLVRPLWAAA